MRSARPASTRAPASPLSSMTTTLMVEEPMSMPAVNRVLFSGIVTSSLGSVGGRRLVCSPGISQGEESRSQGTGVDRVRRDVDLDVPVVLGDQCLQGVHRGRILRDATGEGELVLDAARAREQGHCAQNDGPMQSRQDVLTLFSQRQPFPQLGARKDRAGRVDANWTGEISGEGTELVQTQIHLVRDIAQGAPAPGRAAIVHLEGRDDALIVDLDSLGVLPADVENGASRREKGGGSQAVAENLGADLAFGEGKPLSTIAGAYAADLIQLDVDHALDRALKSFIGF